MKNRNCHHIVFCADDTYSQYIAVAIKSIAENHQSRFVIVHFLTDYISDTNIRRIREVVDEYEHVEFEIHHVDDSPLRTLKVSAGWPIQAWYRLLIPEILDNSIKKVLYLDVDTLVVSDLGELFAANLEGVSVAGTVEASVFDKSYYKRIGIEYDEKYLCAGVLLMNLEFWREHNLTQKMIDWAKTHKTKMADQDTINYVCRDSKKVLPMRYGVVQFYFSIEDFYREPYLSELADCLERPAIIHYASCVPWYRDVSRHVFYDRWIKYNSMLRHPVRRRYKSKGWLKLKLIVWNLIHSFEKRQYMTAESVRVKIDNIKNGRAL